MAVYVDNYRGRYPGYRSRPRAMVMCHMMADTEDELHAMADALALRRSWFQGDHYDICQSKRAEAVKLGAREVSSMELVALRCKQRTDAKTHRKIQAEQGEQRR